MIVAALIAQLLCQYWQEQFHMDVATAVSCVDMIVQCRTDKATTIATTINLVVAMQTQPSCQA